MGLEVLAEGELLGEAEFVRYLLDQHVRLAQEVLRLTDGDHVNPLHRCIIGLLFDDVRKMPWRHMLLRGVILNGSMLPVLLIKGEEKGHEHLPSARRHSRRFQQLVAEQEYVLHDCLLTQQVDGGLQYLTLYRMGKVAQLLLFGVYLVHTLQEETLLLVGQVHERRDSQRLLRCGNTLREECVDIPD